MQPGCKLCVWQKSHPQLCHVGGITLSPLQESLSYSYWEFSRNKKRKTSVWKFSLFYDAMAARRDQALFALFSLILAFLPVSARK